MQHQNIVIMQHKIIKHFVLLIALMLTSSWGNALGLAMLDGYSNIQIKESNVQEAPKTSSILASINGHALSVVFTENFGQVFIEVTDTNGGPVDMNDMYTPNGYNAYIHYAGSYIITFTFADGDVYYGEFDVVD